MKIVKIIIKTLIYANQVKIVRAKKREGLIRARLLGAAKVIMVVIMVIIIMDVILIMNAIIMMILVIFFGSPRS